MYFTIDLYVSASKIVKPLRTCILLFVIGHTNSVGEKSSSRLSPPTGYVNLIQPKARFKSKSSTTPYIEIVFTHVRGENDQNRLLLFLKSKKELTVISERTCD